MTAFLNQENSKKYEIVFLLVFSLAFVWLSSGFFFFWDNIIQLSVPANYYYDTHFGTLYLPDEITTGHQPFVGMYLAVGWMIFGRSIEISHWLIWPFVFGTLFQLLRFIRFFVKDPKICYIIFLSCILESVFITQLSLLTFEIFHIFFFLAALNAFLRKEKLWTAIFFSGLMLVSLRATMSGIGIIVFVFLNQIFIDKKFRISDYFAFIPGFLLFGLFLLSFYIERGWIVHNMVSKSWEQSSKYADLKGILRNIFIFLWHLVDLGKIILWLLLIYIIGKSIKKRSLDKNFLIIMLITFGQFIIFFCTTIPYQNSIAHRYVLPITLIFSVGIIYWFLKYEKKRKFFIVYIFAYIISGYFWLYPLQIAKAWDSMPLHWSYYSEWYDMKNYIESHKISPSDVESFFPNTAPFKNIILANDNLKYGNGYENKRYLLFSNAYNESDEALYEIFNSGTYTLVHKEQKGAVYLILLKKKN